MNEYEIKVQGHDSVSIYARDFLNLFGKLNQWMSDNCAYQDELLSIELIPPPTSRIEMAEPDVIGDYARKQGSSDL